jgi:hypothetical protein
MLYIWNVIKKEKGYNRGSKKVCEKMEATLFLCVLRPSRIIAAAFSLFLRRKKKKKEKEKTQEGKVQY